MLPVPERSDTVIDKTGGAAPHCDVAVFDPQAAHGILAAFAAPQKYRRQAERNRDDRGRRVFLVAILMEAQFGAGGITIDQASVRIIAVEPGLSREGGTASLSNREVMVALD